jgi:hypothetical protein
LATFANDVKRLPSLEDGSEDVKAWTYINSKMRAFRTLAAASDAASTASHRSESCVNHGMQYQKRP